MAVLDIIRYLGENRGRYAEAELRVKLRATGYPEAEIQEALRLTNGVSPSPAVQSSSQALGRKILSWILGFVAGGLLLGGGAIVTGGLVPYSFRYFGFGRLSLLSLYLVPIGFAVAFYVVMRRRSPYFARGLLVALMIGAGFVVIGILFLMMVFGGGFRFF